MQQTDLEKLSPAERRALLAEMLRRQSGQRAALPPLPLSEGERAIWYYHEINRDNVSLNLGEAIRVPGGLSRQPLLTAVAGLVERHELLRSRVVMLSGEPFKRILPKGSVPIEPVDLSGASVAEKAVRLGRFIDQRFDLAASAPIRIGLSEDEDGDSVLVFSMHHLSADFWSLVILIIDFFNLYAAALHGRPAALPPITASYGDFVAEQSRFLRSPEVDEPRRYWKAALADLPALPSLGTGAGADETEQGSISCFELDPEIIRLVREFSKGCQVSTYCTLLGAFALLLARRSGQDGVVIGAPMTGRSHERYSNVVGYFDNPLPLLIRPSAGMKAGEFVRHVQEVVLGAVRNQAYPLQRIIEDVRPMHGARAAGMFNTVFTMLQAPTVDATSLTTFGIGDPKARATLAGIDLRSEPVRRRSAQVDLALTLATPNGRLVGAWEYDRSKLSLADIADLSDALRAVLESIAKDEAAPVDRLPVLSRREGDWLVHDLNRTEAPGPEALLLHEPFAEQARREPDRPAILGSGLKMSFAELDRRSNAVARWLQGQGLAPAEHVAVIIPKGWQQVAAVIGISKAGGSYLPIDPDSPEARVAKILARGGARLVLTAEGPAAPLPPGSFTSATVEALGSSDDSPAAERDPARRAYTIFTSGSTGEPKGVMIAHGAALNTLHDVNCRLGVGSDDRVLALSSLSFDLSVYDIFGALGAGAAIVLPEPEELHMPEHWLDLCEVHGVTLWNSVPALFGLALDSAEQSPSTALRSLRAVMLSGDWIPLDLPERARSACGDHRFISMGGATEASVWSIWHEVAGIDPSWTSIPYGLPMANQRFHVLDEHLQPVPLGVVGELYIGGTGVMLGYCGDPELTGRSLLRVPFDDGPIYRTGDLGRRSPSGVIEFLGRRDSQVKIRGFRIELGEIETALKSHPGIRDCVVLPDGRGDALTLAACFVAGKEVESADLRRQLESRLPAYMVPTVWKRVERLPLTANGKVDREALSARLGEPDCAGPKARMPQSPEEELLVKLVGAALGRTVGPEDDLIALGANSVHAIRIAASLRSAGFDVRTRDLFETTRLSALAARLPDRILARRKPAGAPPIGTRRSPPRDLPPYRATLSMPAGMTAGQVEEAWAAVAGEASAGTSRDLSAASAVLRAGASGSPVVQVEVPASLTDMEGFSDLVSGLRRSLAGAADPTLSGAERPGSGSPGVEPHSGDVGGSAWVAAGQLLVPLGPVAPWRNHRLNATEFLTAAILAILPDSDVVTVTSRDWNGADEHPASSATQDLAWSRSFRGGTASSQSPVGRESLHEIFEFEAAAPRLELLVTGARPEASEPRADGIEILDWQDGPVAGCRADSCILAEISDESIVFTALERFAAGPEAWLAPIARAVTALAEAPASTRRPTSMLPLREDELTALQAAYPDAGEIWPLAPMQHTMLIHGLVERTSGLYCQHLYWRTEGALDDDRLIAAFRRVVAETPCLRAAFDPWRASEPVQVVRSRADVEFERIEIAQGCWRDDLQALVESDRERGFDLAEAPLLRVTRLVLDDRSSVLVLCHHHLLFDGWSVGLILDALLEAYDGVEPGAALGRYPVFLQHLSQRPVDEAKAYWKTLLEGADLIAPLPAARDDVSAEDGPRQREQEVAWDELFVSRLEAGARDCGVTASAMMLSAWALVLARYCGRDDVVFGVTGAGRPEEVPDVADIAGMFINTVPIRVAAGGEEELGSVARSVHRQYTRSREFEQTSFHELADALGVQPRDFDPFRTVLIFENYPEEDWRRAPKSDLAFARPEFTELTATPLSIYVFPSRSWTVRFVYDSKLFDEAAVAALAAQLKTAMARLFERPSAKVGSVSLASEKDLRFFGEVNSTEQVWEEPATLCALLAERAAATPDSPGLRAGSASLTYKELDLRATDLACHLVAAGIGRGDLVALSCGHTVELIVGIYGVLRAGAAFLPLDESAPRLRKEEIVRSSRAKLVLTDGQEFGSGGIGVEVIDLTRPRPPAAAVPLPRPSPGDAAYVIYTSGSSGVPKGVAVSHQSVANYALATGRVYGWTSSDRLLQFFSLGFDASLEVIFGAMAVGATLVLRPSGVQWSLEAFTSALREHEISSVSVTTAFWHIWLEALDASGEPLPPAVRSVLIGGESNRASGAAAWRRLAAGREIRLFNTYGPTEATIVACVSEVTAEAIGRPGGDEFPIGGPVPNVSVHVLDRHGQLSPRGAIGELHIGGIGVANGYWGDPERTAEVFLTSPLASGRLYKTGDRARFREDGQLEFRGRVDSQMKVRGYRVEPGEIESEIRRCAGVRDCVVGLVKDGAPEQLVAHIIVEPGFSNGRGESSGGAAGDGAAGAAAGFDFDRQELKADLRRRLPDYMVPDRLFLVDAFPLTSNGKIDRAALPSDGPDLIEAAFDAPRGETEETIAAIWSELLGIERIGREDNFFELGGHSLLAMQMVARLSQAFEVQPSVGDLFTTPTVASLADAVLRIMLEEYSEDDVALVSAQLGSGPG